MFAFKYCKPNLCSPSCLKTPNPGAMDSLMQQATGNKPNGTLRPFPASQISSGMPNSATKNVRRKRSKLVVTGCHGEETNSEKRSFLSLEEAGLVEISGLSTHERFLCRLTSTCAKLGCTQGWFCASLFHPSSRNIAQLAKVKILKRPGLWEELHVPRSIRSIVCLNLPSFSGGLNPWGTPHHSKARDRDLTPPYVDDGLLEVVGFRDARHGLVLLAPNGHGTRLAQAHRIRFEFHKGAADHTYMRIDGEPWKQPLPENDDAVVVEISHLGQVNMLATPSCISKSMYDPSMSPSVSGHLDDDEVSAEESDDDSVEERRKFGAAETFRIPEEVDIAHLS